MPTESVSKKASEAVKQTTNIEAVMQSHLGSYPMPMLPSCSRELLESALTKAFISQPILGNIILSKEQRRKIHTIAEGALYDALGRTYIKDYGIGDFYCDILTLETVLLLRNWSAHDSDGDDCNEDMNFWEYICNQYALTYDENFGNSHSYRIFRQVIKRSLQRHNRLFVKVGQRYYTTMLTHALAPAIKFYDLFEQIIAFYARTLNYQYIKGDSAFQAFSQALKSRFENKHSYVDDDVYIKSMQSTSAIRALFLYCPKYMGSLVEDIVRNIDMLVAFGKIHENTYLDTLLLNWYKKRSREERSLAKRERTKASFDRVITEFSNIRPFYRYEAGKVLLIIPPIRLGRVAEKPPRISIYRNPNDLNPRSSTLQYYGDYFCITSSKVIIPIDKVLFDNSERIEPRIIISHNNKSIYDSGLKLYRNAIVFGDDGSEINQRPNQEYIDIFVTNSGHVEGETTSPDCSAIICGNGYLYRALIDDETYFVINGTDLFPIEQIVSELTLKISVAPVSHCKYLINQQEYTIFAKRPNIIITSENQSWKKQYRLIIDDKLYPFAKQEYHMEINNSYRIDLPDEHGIHELRIIENATQLRVHTFHYIVLEGLSLHFTGFYYFPNFNSNGAVEIIDNDGVYRKTYEVFSNSRHMLVPYKDGDLSIDIPILYCRLNDKLVSPNADHVIWYEDIPMSALLEINVPRDFSCTTMIGQDPYMSEKIEIGNEIRTRYDSPIETVGLILRKDSEEMTEIKLFDIAFKPFFETVPILAEKDILYWFAEENYIGARNSKFELIICRGNEEIMCYKLGCTDEMIPTDSPLEDGMYSYTVFKESSRFFRDLEEIMCGQFIIGNPALLRFDNLAIIVTEAIIDNDRLKLNHTSGIITGLQYKGELGLNGEILRYPCYEGYLQYKHDGRIYPYATRDYERNEIYHEQINPIKLWVINEYIISLRTPLDDGLYVNKHWKSITDRIPPRSCGQSSYYNPDYYAFKIITQEEVENV